MNRRFRPAHWALAALCAFTSLSTQAQSLQWVNRIGGTGMDRSHATAFDNNGNMYITGIFTGTVDFDPGLGTANLTAGGTRGAYLAKYSTSGDYIWAISIGGTGENSGNALSVDASGNVAIAGEFSGTTDFDPGAGTTSRTASTGGSMFLARYSAAGALQWVNTIGANSRGSALSQDAAGNLYISGIFYGTADFDPGPGTTNRMDTDGNLYVAAYSSSGAYIWVKNLAPNLGSLFVNTLALDKTGNIYLSGEFTGSTDFDPSSATATMAAIGYQDIFLMKLDKIGNFKWANHMGCPVNVNTGKAIAVDKWNNVTVTGMFYNTVDFDPGPGTANLASPGNYNIYLAQYDSLGKYKWAKNIGSTTTSSANQGRSVVVDDDGNFYVAGNYAISADFDPGPGTAMLNAKLIDMFVAKYDKMGNYLWAKSMNAANAVTSPSYSPTAILGLDKQGNLYASGSFVDTTNFSWGSTPMTKASAGDLDIFITRYKVANVGVTSNGNIGGDVQLFPNPAHEAATIAYYLKEAGDVSLTLSDITGRLIRRNSYRQQQGQQAIRILTSSLAPGTYIVTLQNGQERISRQLVVTGQ